MATLVGVVAEVFTFEALSGTTSSFAQGSSNPYLFGGVAWANFGSLPSITALKEGGSGGNDITFGGADVSFFFGQAALNSGSVVPGPTGNTTIYGAANTGLQGLAVGISFSGVASSANYTTNSGAQGDTNNTVCSIVVPDCVAGRTVTGWFVAISGNVSIDEFTDDVDDTEILAQDLDPGVTFAALCAVRKIADANGPCTLQVRAHSTSAPGTDAIAWASAAEQLIDAGGGGGATANVTGVGATGSAGNVSASASSTATITGVQGSGQTGNVSASSASVAQVTGVSATGAAGTLTPTSSSTASVTGVAASGAVGSLNASVGSVASVTGVEGSGQVGPLTATSSSTVALVGVEAQGQAGTVNASTGGTLTSVTGVAAAGAVGTLGVAVDSTAVATGVQAQGQAGDLGVVVSSSVVLTGVEGTGAVTSPTASVNAAATANITGVQAAGAVGDLAPSSSSTVTLTGVQADGQVGSPSIASTGITVTLEGVAGVGEVGDLVASGPAVITEQPLDGAGWGVGNRLPATIDRTYREHATVTLAGVEARGAVGPVQAMPEVEQVEVSAADLDAIAPQLVKLRAAPIVVPVDAEVVLTGVEGRVVPFRPRRLGKAMHVRDHELEAFVVRVASGWP